MTATDRLAEIRVRLAAATPGSWDELPLDDPTCASYSAICAGRTPLFATDWNYGDGFPYPSPADVALVTHAPDDIAWLLGELERLSGALAEARSLTWGHHVAGERIAGDICPHCPKHYWEQAE